jgi:hypothetical protein
VSEGSKPVQHALEKRQFWDGVGKSLSKNLPGLIQFAASNVSWLMKLTEAPSKFTTMRPSVDWRATKMALRYGPFLLTGSNVREH